MSFRKGYSFIQAEQGARQRFPAPGRASDPYAPGIAWAHFMTTEFDRRNRLMDKCLELANLAFEQKDVETGGLMLSKALQLLNTQLNACELMQPGFIASLKDSPDWVDLARMLNKSE